MRPHIDVAWVTAGLLSLCAHGSALAESQVDPPPGYPTRTVPDPYAVDGHLDLVAGSDHGLIDYFRKLPVAHK